MDISYQLVNLPFKILFGIVGFLVWEVFSSREWKRRPRLGTNPAGYWQDQAQWATHQNRVNEDKHHRRDADKTAFYERELKKREREISRLRSQLNNKR